MPDPDLPTLPQPPASGRAPRDVGEALAALFERSQRRQRAMAALRFVDPSGAQRFRLYTCSRLHTAPDDARGGERADLLAIYNPANAVWRALHPEARPLVQALRAAGQGSVVLNL